MTIAPESLACFTWVDSCAASVAPMTMTFAPLVTIALICACWSATVVDAPAYWTSDLKPASLRPLVNRSPARTQFSEVFDGSATPMSESFAKPLAEADELGAASRLEPQALAPSASSATALTARRLGRNLRMGRGALLRHGAARVGCWGIGGDALGAG